MPADGATCVSATRYPLPQAIGLYRGVGSPLFGVSFLNMALFYSYGWSLALLRHGAPAPVREAPGNVFAAGVIAGSLNCLLASPIEMVKTRLQMMQQLRSRAVRVGDADALRRLPQVRRARRRRRALGRATAQSRAVQGQRRLPDAGAAHGGPHLSRHGGHADTRGPELRGLLSRLRCRFALADAKRAPRTRRRAHHAGCLRCGRCSAAGRRRRRSPVCPSHTGPRRDTQVSAE